jgi:hypothetical protein
MTTIDEAKTKSDRFVTECLSFKAFGLLEEISAFGLATMEARKKYTDLGELAELVLAVGALLRKHPWSMCVEALWVITATMGQMTKAERNLHDQMMELRPAMSDWLDHIHAKKDLSALEKS